MKTLIAIPLPSEYALFCAEELVCSEDLYCCDGHFTHLDSLAVVPQILDPGPLVTRLGGCYPAATTYPGMLTFPGGRFSTEAAGLFPGLTTYPGMSTWPGTTNFLYADPIR